MRTSEKGIAALVGHEGVVPGPYFDSVGVQTYGVGHTAAAGDPNPAELLAGMPSDLDKELRGIFNLFAYDLDKYESAVSKAFTAPLTQTEFDAAVSFHYNTGAIGRATWVKTFNAGDKAKAAAQIMNYSKPPEIIGRRESERRLFRDGIYPDGDATVWNVGNDRRVIWKPVMTLSPDDILAYWQLGTPTPKPTPATGKTGLATIVALIVAAAVGAWQYLFGG